MKSFCFAILLMLIWSFSSFGQETALTFNVHQRSKQIKKYSYSLSNSLNYDLAILIREKKKAHAYLYDSVFSLKSEFTFDYAKKSKYNVILGERILGSEYSLLYSNSINNRFCIFTINFESKKSYLKELRIDFKNERYLKTITHNNRLYILSVDRLENKIFIRELNDNYEFDIVKSHFLELEKNQKLHENSTMKNGFWATIKPNIIKIDNRIPNTIEHVSEENKIYEQDDSLYLTFDNNSNSTLMYVINLKDYSIDRKEFVYPKGEIDDYIKFNSYFVDNKLFQIASSNKEMIFAVRDLNGSILKSYYFDKERPINIKNSAIIQDGVTALPFVNKREFEETSKFLRKITSGNIGISAYKKEGAYHFIIGGTKQVNRNFPAPMMVPNTTLVSVNNQMVPITTYNPVYSSYNSYSTTKSTYFNTKFDSSFDYVKGSVDNNVFEKIKKYEEDLKYTSGEDVFYHNNQLFFSYFDLKNGKFNLVQF
ncbi:hypothetical protein [Seonamhaeicola maritimus]|uniref:hypothetical protein n=1 Tax=Seonamhaeicola maritimus TaxID=2591822 RepID=UPI0024949632|nr:hypothetical protein [Seonamhaeicola maritimus]